MEQNDEKIIKEDFSVYEEWRTYPPVPDFKVTYTETEKMDEDNNTIIVNLSDSETKNPNRQEK